jgi:hypothetical protein
VKRTIQLTAVAALMSGAAIVHALGATSEDRFRFETIPLHNAFALRASIPPPPVTPEVPELPQPKVVVTGITDLGGTSRVLLESTDPGRPVARAILSEGDTFGFVRVLWIDVPAGRVKVRIRDVESTLTFEPARTPPPLSPVRGLNLCLKQPKNRMVLTEPITYVAAHEVE